MILLDNNIYIPIDFEAPTGSDYVEIERDTSGNITNITYRDDGSSGKIMGMVSFTYDGSGKIQSMGVNDVI